MNKLRPLYVILLLTTACSINESHDMCEETHDDITIMDKQTGIWIIPQEDPYRIDPTSTKSTPKATHYAMTIHPKTLAELRSLERDNSITVSYIPFGYTISSQEKPNITNNQHLVSDYSSTTSCQEIIPEDIGALPTLYAIWPIDKPINPEYDYAINYSVRLPVVPNEIVNLEEILSSINKGEKSLTYKLGRLTFSDDFLSRTDIAVNNVKIRFQYGSLIQDVYTNSAGYFLAPSDVNDSTSVSYILQGSDWTVSYDTSYAPLVCYMGKVGTLWNGTSIINYAATGLYETVYRAADYLYTTSFTPQLSLYPEITIKVQSFPGTNNQYGSFAYNSSVQYVMIFPRTGTDNEFISATLHELGHAMQYTLRGGSYTSYNGVERVVKESFASFTGWYYGEQYYLSLGWIKPQSSYILNHNARQNWMASDTSTVYTPFFVDLVDDYDQSSSNSNYIWDGLSGCSISEIMFMAKYPSTLEQVISKTFDFCYPSEDVSDYIWQYRDWANSFAHYPPDWWN